MAALIPELGERGVGKACQTGRRLLVLRIEPLVAGPLGFGVVDVEVRGLPRRQSAAAAALPGGGNPMRPDGIRVRQIGRRLLRSDRKLGAGVDVAPNSDVARASRREIPGYQTSNGGAACQSRALAAGPPVSEDDRMGAGWRRPTAATSWSWLSGNVRLADRALAGGLVDEDNRNSGSLGQRGGGSQSCRRLNSTLAWGLWPEWPSGGGIEPHRGPP